MKAAGALILGATAAVLAACVTINIYFPAAAAERAADRVIEEVWQLQEPPAGQPSQTPETGETP
ncbi:MAG: hypothetical protein ACOY42_10670 [Pseudomonadota bacterium]